MSIAVGGFKRQRSLGSDEQVNLAPAVRATSLWACQSGACVPSQEGTYGSRGECEANPRCAPGAEARLAGRRPQRLAAIETMVPAEKAFSSFELSFVPAGQSRAWVVPAAAVEFAWVFHAAGVGAEDVRRCMASSTAACRTGPGVVVLVGATPAARIDLMAADWPGTGVPDAALSQSGVLVTLALDARAPPCAATAAHLRFPQPRKATVWVDRQGAGMLYMPF